MPTVRPFVTGLVLVVIVAIAVIVFRESNTGKNFSIENFLHVPKEPDAVFTWLSHTDGFRAVLVDHHKSEIIRDVIVKTDLPVDIAVSGYHNDRVQYAAATEEIIFSVDNLSAYDGERINPSLPFCRAVFSTNFFGSSPRMIWSTPVCSYATWILHPTQPFLYISTYNGDKKTGELYAIDLLSPSSIRELTKTSYASFNSPLKITADGEDIYQVMEKRDPESVQASGMLRLVRMKTSTGEVSEVVMSKPPRAELIAFRSGASSGNISPHGYYFAYPFGFVDIRTGRAAQVRIPSYHILGNLHIHWSGSEDQLLFQVRDSKTSEPTNRGSYIYNRRTGNTSFIPVINVEQWAPSSRYILYETPVVEGSDELNMWDTKTRTFRTILREDSLVSSAWVYLPAHLEIL